ncbi:MAG TPA: glycosyltransferase family 2 protein [Burkholderiaceae bacterium]|nr:glycosyltransferase family 2 protein [Burkholderiaceae bacterium]
MLISFVFSFRNEEENIPELVRRVSAAASLIPDSSYELIFVNDASSDRSVELLTELQARQPIRIITMSRRFGVTPCVMAGLAHARGDAVVYMDSDLQDPPELVPQMVEKFRDGADVVHTTRTHRDGESAFKMWLTRRAYRVINFFSDINLPENTGDFKLLSRKIVDQILALPEYDPYMRGLSIWVGFRQEFIYYRREARFGGRTKMPLIGKGPIREFIRGLTAFSAAPLYISFFLGLATSLVAVILIVYALATKLLGVAAEGASSVLIAVAFFGGVILMTNGIMGLYLARIYDESKGRPRYIIRNIAEPPAR